MYNYFKAIGRIEEYILEYAKYEDAREINDYSGTFSDKFIEEYNKIIFIKQTVKIIQEIKCYKTLKEGIKKYRYIDGKIRSEVIRTLSKEILEEIQSTDGNLADYL